MLSALASSILVLGLASSASATIAVTFPVASTSCTGGQRGPFKWQIDDTVLPLGIDFGETTVGIFTGSVSQQSLFLDLGTITNPTRTLEIDAVTIPADLGPDGALYFLRFESTKNNDPATGYPLQAFSAKFSLTGMDGDLSPEASAQIQGKTLTTSSARGAMTTAVRSTSPAPSTATSSASNGRVVAAASASTNRLVGNGTSTSAGFATVNSGGLAAVGVAALGVAYIAW